MYSKVSKYSPEARKRMAYRSRQGKSCGYYMRIVFLFSSLIQSLIIVSLVLFLVYGKQQDQSSVERTQELEVRFSQLSLETMSLKQQSKNLTHVLNVTVMEKARNDWELGQLRFAANISYILLEDMEKKLKQCNFEKLSSRANCPPDTSRFMNPFQVPQSPYGGGCNCGTQMETLKAKMQLIQSNFTQTAMQMQMEMDQISRDRDNLNLEAIQLRRDKSVHEKAIQFYQIKCKEEFVNSLSGISNVSKAFLGKIDSLFHSLSPFHITCPKQKEYLEQIRSNCTDLSEEVVSKFQTYLDTLGNRVSMYQGNISVLTAENMRMTRDYNLCSQNRTALIREHKQNVARIQLQNDEEKEKLLKEKIRLKGDIEVLDSSLKLKDSQLNHMNEQLKFLNLSCIPRSGGLYPRFGNQPSSPFGPQAGSSNPSLSSGGNPFNRNTFGSSSSSSSFGSPFGSNTNTGSSSNTGFNKPSSTGIGSSSFGSNSGFGSSSSNNQGSSNQGSSSSLFGSAFGSSSSGSSSNKQTSTGQGSSSSSSLFGSAFGSSSSGSSSNKQTSTGQGSSSSSSSSFGSPFGSSSNNPSSSSSSQSKLGSGTSSSNFGSSSSNTGSKLGSSSSSLGSNFGSSSSNSGLGSSSSSSSSKTTSNSQGSSNSLFGSSSSSSRSGSGSSLGSSLGSSSSNQNKLSSSSTNKGSSSSSSGSSSSSSSGSSATTSKSSFGGWWGLGAGSSSSNSNSNTGSNTDQSKTGSNQGRGTSSSGNTFGSFGRTNTFSYTGPISVNQHLRDLQRFINPQGPEQKQELSRMLG